MSDSPNDSPNEPETVEMDVLQADDMSSERPTQEFPQAAFAGIPRPPAVPAVRDAGVSRDSGVREAEDSLLYSSSDEKVTGEISGEEMDSLRAQAEALRAERESLPPEEVTTTLTKAEVEALMAQTRRSQGPAKPDES